MIIWFRTSTLKCNNAGRFRNVQYERGHNLALQWIFDVFTITIAPVYVRWYSLNSAILPTGTNRLLLGRPVASCVSGHRRHHRRHHHRAICTVMRPIRMIIWYYRDSELSGRTVGVRRAAQCYHCIHRRATSTPHIAGQPNDVNS